MLTIRKQVCSFTGALSLFRVGARGASEWCWTVDSELVLRADAKSGTRLYPAYMLSEMDRMLPESLFGLPLRIARKAGKWRAFYECTFYESTSPELPDAVAGIIFFLAKDGHLDLGKHAA